MDVNTGVGNNVSYHKCLTTSERIIKNFEVLF